MNGLLRHPLSSLLYPPWVRQRIVLFAAALTAISHMSAADYSVRIMTLDPGHFHAGLVQKLMYPQVSPVVNVYAPEGPDVDQHLKRIEGFNTRAENPTHWEEKVYTGADFLDRMLREKPGNVVVISGNNLRKTEYISKSVNARLNVLADKPMAINPDAFKLLRKAFDGAEKHKVLLYDIMTERFEITSILQRELARMPDIFGTIDKGSPGQPAVQMESVHYFFKEVAGKPLIRPPWFYDVAQQGEAVPDVGTHLVDLVQWQCFPDETLNWKKDINVLDANRWATRMTQEQFKRSTGLSDFPDYLKKYVRSDGKLHVYQNGDVTWSIRGVHAKVTALWHYEAPPGTKDTHYAVIRGSGAILTIRQGPEENFAPVLYVENKAPISADQFETKLRAAVGKLCSSYPGVEVKPSRRGWQIVVPEKYAVGHEAHFTQVTEAYLDFLKSGKMPSWEVPNMIAKYYTTSEAYRISHGKK